MGDRIRNAIFWGGLTLSAVFVLIAVVTRADWPGWAAACVSGVMAASGAVEFHVIHQRRRRRAKAALGVQEGDGDG